MGVCTVHTGGGHVMEVMGHCPPGPQEFPAGLRDSAAPAAAQSSIHFAAVPLESTELARTPSLPQQAGGDGGGQGTVNL